MILQQSIWDIVHIQGTKTEGQERRRANTLRIETIIRKRKRMRKRLCAIGAAVCFMLVIGIVGGIERGSIGLVWGGIGAVISLAICHVCISLAGGYQSVKSKREVIMLGEDKAKVQ